MWRALRDVLVPDSRDRISRAVFAIGSPMIGGFSKWDVLRDSELSKVMPEAFGPVPEVIAGLSPREAELESADLVGDQASWLLRRNGAAASARYSRAPRVPAPAIQATPQSRRRLILRRPIAFVVGHILAGFMQHVRRSSCMPSLCMIYGKYDFHLAVLLQELENGCSVIRPVCVVLPIALDCDSFEFNDRRTFTKR